MVQRLDGRGIGHITVHLYSYYLHNKYCRAARQQKALDTTAIYTHVATDILHEVISPLEALRSP